MHLITSSLRALTVDDGELRQQRRRLESQSKIDNVKKNSDIFTQTWERAFATALQF